MTTDRDCDKLPLVMEDGWHCDPACPYLSPSKDPDDVRGSCLKDGQDLDWYDFYIALCVVD